MRWPGHVIFTLRIGESLPHVPSHLDCLAGAGRPASRLRNEKLDRVLNRYGGGGRCSCVFHARHSLGKAGEQHVGFDEIEEQLGLSRTYRIQIGHPQATGDVVDALREIAGVESAAEQTLATAPLAAGAAPSAIDLRAAWEPYEQIRAREARAIEPGDERITTATVDTGIIIGHPEFQRKCLAGYDTVDLGIGRLNSTMSLVGDSRGSDYNPHDDVGHGCLVAGIIGARGWRVPPGVAGRSLLLPVRVLAAAVADRAAKRVGVGALGDIDAGLKVAVDLGAVVINMSFGTPASSADKNGPPPHQRVIDYADHNGCILVAAAGNSALEEDYFPARHEKVIAVGALDRDLRRARFSTYGKHIALSAPGVRIIGTGLRGYQMNSGTSFAAPFVTGVAALLASRARRAGRTLNSAQAKRILIESARPLGGGFNNETGHGILDAAAALRKLDDFLGRPQ